MSEFSTLIIGYDLNQAVTKPRDQKAKVYFDDLVKGFDIGGLSFIDEANFKPELDRLQPFIVIVFNEILAGQVKQHRPDNFLYVVHHPRSVFYRKSEFEKRDKDVREKFTEMAWIAGEIRKAKDNELEALRKVAGMGYKEKYDMVQRALISDNKELSAKAAEALRDNSNSEMVWMRANLVVDVWTHSDAKRMEEFLVLAMDDHVANGFAKPMVNFIDSDGVEYKQYMFVYPDGSESNYVRRIPLAGKMEKYGYMALLEKYETPNGPQIMMEVGQVKKLRQESQSS